VAKISDKLAQDTSSLALSWALMLTLLRKKIITKEELLSSLELSKRPEGQTLAIDELIKVVEGMNVVREDN
jgi:hypothetical protein